MQTNAIAALLAAAYASGACAADTGTSIFSFDAFGTLGVVHSSEDQADFTSSFFKPSGAGVSDDWSFDVDSLIGGQVTVDITPQLAAVVQVVAELNYDGSYRPHVEWANIKYDVTPDFSVRFGRTVMPIALLSDTRKVSYTYPWVRPPMEIYGQLPLTSSDGIDLSYRLHKGSLTNTVQVGAGRKISDTPDYIGPIETRRLRFISNTAALGSFTGRIAYVTSSVTLPSINRRIFDPLRRFGPQGEAIADRYNADATRFSLLSVGANYDPGRWFVTAEWGWLESNSFVDSTAWHTGGGYRFGPFMPYATYARIWSRYQSDPGLDLSIVPPALAEGAAALNAGLNGVLRNNATQSTVSLGCRWDFVANASLKLQLDHIRIGAESTGVLINAQPGFEPGGHANVFSATIDFVF